MLYIAYLNKDDDIQHSACILQARAHFALPVRCRYYIGFKSTGFVCALVFVGMLAIIVSIKRLWNVMTWAFSDIVNVLDEKQDISIDEIADYDELPEEEDDIPIESIIFRPSA